MQKSIYLIGSALALCAGTAAAAAGENVADRAASPSAAVSLADLDLATPAGLAKGKARIDAAAADLCLTNSVEPINVRVARSKCYQAAVSDGYQQLNHLAHAEIASSGATVFGLTKTAR